MKRVTKVVGLAILIVGVVVLVGRGLTPAQRITIGVPFDINDPPNGLIPMGETIEHPKPDNPEGHTGIDFLWWNESGRRKAQILSAADGVICGIVHEDGEWGVSIQHGSYATFYFHLNPLNPELKIGQEVKKGDFLGLSGCLHWEFGYSTLDPIRIGRICPMSYFDAESRAVMESIPIMEKFRDQYPSVCSGEFEGKDR